VLLFYNINISILPIIRGSLNLERVQQHFLWLFSYLFKIEIHCVPHDFAPVASIMLAGLSSWAEQMQTAGIRFLDMLLNVKIESSVLVFLIIYFKLPICTSLFILVHCFVFHVPPAVQSLPIIWPMGPIRDASLKRVTLKANMNPVLLICKCNLINLS